MYLRTPKRYTNKGRKRYLLNFRRVAFWIIMPLLIVGMWQLYRHRETLAPVVSSRAETAINQGQQIVSTMMAPTPMPTENPVNVIVRGDTNWQAGRVEDALAAYEEVLPAVPNDVATHYNVALGYIVQGRYAEALDAAERAITADPFSSDAWAIRSLAQTRNNNPGGAIASGQQALELNGQNANAHAYLTEAYIALNLPERARASAEAAIEADPNNPAAYYARAQVSHLVDFDFETARIDYETAYNLGPFLTDAAVDKAFLDAGLNDYEAAINTLLPVRDANPDSTTVLYALGYMYFAGLGDPNQAADVLDRCVAVDPSSDLCQYYYGRVLLRQERYEEAADRLTRAVRLSEEEGLLNPRYSYWAGEAQIALGNCPLALNFVRPGIAAAEEQNNEELITALDVLRQECAAFDIAPPTATPDAITTPDADATPTPEAESTPNA